MILHHELTVPVGLHVSGKCNVHLPLRKIVACRTCDLQQSLLAKLGHATQSAQAPKVALAAQYDAQESPFEVVSNLPLPECTWICRSGCEWP